MGRFFKDESFRAVLICELIFNQPLSCKQHSVTKKRLTITHQALKSNKKACMAQAFLIWV